MKSLVSQLLPEQTIFIRSQADIDRLINIAQPLLSGRGISAQPAFYLASLIRNRWSPAIIAVLRGHHLAGIVYMKERKVLGFRTGIYYGDSTLDSLVVADEQLKAGVLHSAMRALLEKKTTRALRLVVSTNGYESVEIAKLSLTGILEIRSKSINHHSQLRLQSSYTGFLEGLGSKTRRNFRYYRRRFESLNHEFVSDLSLPEFRAASLSLAGKDAAGTKRFRLAHALSVLSSVSPVSRVFLCGLRHHNGGWLSVLGGWYDINCAVVFFQLNSSKAYGELSLSVVMRAYLIEKLIGTGIRKVLFWGGTTEPLHRHSSLMPTERLYLDKHSLSWRATRAFLRTLNNLVSQRLAYYTEWTLPPTEAE